MIRSAASRVRSSPLAAFHSAPGDIKHHSSASGMGNSRPPLQGVIFDMDGTMTKPQNYMFKKMREALDIDGSQDILLSIQNLPQDEQEPAHEKIRAIERDAMALMEPQDGLIDIMKYLDTLHLQRGICTRNFAEPTQHLLRTYLKDHKIFPVITREFTPQKPSPEPLLEICNHWKFAPEACLMVGDGKDDLVSAQKAGMDSVLLKNKDNIDLIASHKPTYVIEDLRELVSIIKKRI